jgi:hypothetical protein
MGPHPKKAALAAAFFFPSPLDSAARDLHIPDACAEDAQRLTQA